MSNSVCDESQDKKGKHLWPRLQLRLKAKAKARAKAKAKAKAKACAEVRGQSAVERKTTILQARLEVQQDCYFEVLDYSSCSSIPGIIRAAGTYIIQKALQRFLLQGALHRTTDGVPHLVVGEIVLNT